MTVSNALPVPIPFPNTKDPTSDVWSLVLGDSYPHTHQFVLTLYMHSHPAIYVVYASKSQECPWFLCRNVLLSASANGWIRFTSASSVQYPLTQWLLLYLKILTGRGA